ncbi:MAG: bifunctional pyr operon transcriptional regulator/uracil phosphoribosyltransferase PyrR [Pseudomonadota bacterium]
MTPLLPDPETLCAELVQQLRAHATPDTALVGIHTGGVYLAERLHAALGIVLPLGLLDISFYRDDFDKTGLHPQIKPTKIPFDIAGRHIILVDDVLYTGRTVRGAMNELFDYGRPASISLAVLIDRGGRELPVAAQYIGARLEVPTEQMLVLDRYENGKLRLKFDA